MSNRKMSLSEEGKKILDLIAESLEVERPMAIKVALAKGIAVSNGPVHEEYPGSNRWTIPDSIIKDKEFLLFKHLIINEVNKSIDDEEIQKHMLSYIEKGLRTLKDILNSKTSMEDFRLSIL
ncbi:hypothetical protein JOC77_001038 [Peribacillus deserti]|uniref:DUF1832 domain-containing protein n=1 Tax=Peribacillus deserti TaxID=673318 RepID=A0ABS2QH83_9BACI|nr:hypothetical protein [Peribacillus deserti]MBM7691631.1 hypothetical protein [Peribacillus deserti]